VSLAPTPCTPKTTRCKSALTLTVASVIVLSSLADASFAAPHGGGARGGGAARSGARGGSSGAWHGGGFRGGGFRGGARRRSGEGWGGAFFPSSPLIYGSPYYCNPPLIAGVYPFNDPYRYPGDDYCE